MTKRILFAGFGGQGILFSGKFLAYEGLMSGREVSWLPSYGPEMRGGTASCGVILSDAPIGSPIVTSPDILVAMNLPSLDRYEDETAPGGQIFVDGALIERKVKRRDVEAYYIPATKLASDSGLEGLANMIILGHVLRHTELMAYENVGRAMAQIVSAKRKNLYDLNLKAIDLGYRYGEQQAGGARA